MRPSVLATDGYKFSMAEAGWPLRQETFYYSHRRGGPHFLPFDVEEMVRGLLPDTSALGGVEERHFLDSAYPMGGAFWSAVRGPNVAEKVVIRAAPKGSWFFDREPLFTVTGPSALVSWLEPLVLQLHYRIQLATVAKLEPERLPELLHAVTCEAQRDIALETLDAVGVMAPPVRVDSDAYYAHVLERVTQLVEVVGDPSRIFEVGLRAATCVDQHRIALQACKKAGVTATSHVLLAKELGLRPVGTMGHEHVQRFGSDALAFRAMRDRFPGPSSFLLDTFDTVRSGLPEAYDLIAEAPHRGDSVRFDSGDKVTQYLVACSMAKARGLTPRFILEDGFTVDMTREFERLRAFTGVAADHQLYGFGGYIVKAPGDPLTRDRVAAVWKVSQSGPAATMKFGDEPGAGKESLPGRPLLFRPFLGRSGYAGPTGVVLQEGEAPPSDDGVVLSGLSELPMRLKASPDEVRAWASRQARPAYSRATQALVDQLTADRGRALGRR